MKASFIEDWNDTRMVTCHEWSWMPLEVILDSYLQMVDEGKVEAVSKEQAALLDGDPKIGVVEPWVIHQYTKIDVERAATAFKRLTNAIEFRIPMQTRDKDKPQPQAALTALPFPWHDPATYNADILPLHHSPTNSYAPSPTPKSHSAASPPESASQPSQNSQINP